MESPPALTGRRGWVFDFLAGQPCSIGPRSQGHVLCSFPTHYRPSNWAATFSYCQPFPTASVATWTRGPTWSNLIKSPRKQAAASSLAVSWTSKHTLKPQQPPEPQAPPSPTESQAPPAMIERGDVYIVFKNAFNNLKAIWYHQTLVVLQQQDLAIPNRWSRRKLPWK